MRLIDADAFKSWVDEYVSVFKKSDKAEIKGYISHQPSIDIVTCYMCKYSHMTYDGQCKYCDNITDDDGNVIEVYFDADHYCSDGEREGE